MKLLAYLYLFPAEKLCNLLGKFPEFGEVDVPAVDSVSTTLVQEVHVLHEQAEEWDHNLKNGKKRK